MSDNEMLTVIDSSILATAFPLEYRTVAMLGALEASRLLAAHQWTELFDVQVNGQTVLIPARLHFSSHALTLIEEDDAWRFARALQTRSSDGFERQRAARDLLAGLEPWAAPFIVTLIGEYIVEILEDVFSALTPDLEKTLGTFIAQNSPFWETTVRRVNSYWNVYYRHGNGGSRTYPRADYVGFKLVERLGIAASASA